MLTPLGFITPTIIKITIIGTPTLIADSTLEVTLPIANPRDTDVTVIRQ